MRALGHQGSHSVLTKGLVALTWRRAVLSAAPIETARNCYRQWTCPLSFSTSMPLCLLAGAALPRFEPTQQHSVAQRARWQALRMQPVRQTRCTQPARLAHRRALLPLLLLERAQPSLLWTRRCFSLSMLAQFHPFAMHLAAWV